MKNEFSKLLGPKIGHLDFEIVPDQGDPLNLDSYVIKISRFQDGWIVTGTYADMKIQWTFKPIALGWQVNLSVNHSVPKGLKSITALQFDFNTGDEDMDHWLVPVSGNHVSNTGFVNVKNLSGYKAKATGIFKDGNYKGIFLSAIYPLSYSVNCTASKTGTEQLHFIAQTQFNPNHKSAFHQSESFWICTDSNMKNAVEAYASLYKEYQVDKADIPVGWNSWDYYYRTVSLEDVIENMEFIRKDPDLSENIKYITVDDGWNHNWGEWQPNYRFPGGLERLVKEISDRGFIPGIWTAPLQVESLSTPAMRTPEILIKNQYGDPLPSDAGGHYLVDPTSPGGRGFLQELFARLYDLGFRLFKVDYVRSLLKVNQFYEEGVGPYEALRELFRIIRSCVKDSHIIGCSLPEECGPFVVDSGRITIDIHNQWSHVEWVTDSILHNYWMHKKIWINDPDFLVVRGLDTSFEKETNVTNPAANNPNPGRWRSGPVFNEDEAMTWTNMVIMCGGNVFLGDRLSKLNDKGLSFVKKALKPSGISAKPLDLGDDLRPYFWLQDLGTSYRLMVVNWKDTEHEFCFDFTKYRLTAPKQLTDDWSKQIHQTLGGRLNVFLRRHESILVQWEK